VGHVMSKHVDCYAKARPTESLAALVAWGEDADAFNYNLNLQVMALQATRHGDHEAAEKLERISGLKPQLPPKQWRSKTERVRALMAADPNAHGLPPRLYKSDDARRERLSSSTAAAFDGLTAGVKEMKAAREDNFKLRAEQMRQHKEDFRLALAAKREAELAAAEADDDSDAEESAEHGRGAEESSTEARQSAAQRQAMELAHMARDAAAPGRQTVARYPRSYANQYRSDMPARANLGLK